MIIYILLTLIIILTLSIYNTKKPKDDIFKHVHLQWHGDASGSVRKLTLSGITFDVLSDSNFNQTGSQTENDRIPTSGNSFQKKTKRIMKVESVIVKCDPNTRNTLEALADSLEDFSMSYTTADESVFRAKGSIEFESVETEENRGTIQLHPNAKWEKFVA